MSVRDFDKALQEKAQQLRLEPSPQVWAGVAEELHRKRRRKGASWIFTAAAVITGLAIFITGNLHNNYTPAKGIVRSSAPAENLPGAIPHSTNDHKANSVNDGQPKPTRIDQNSTFSENETAEGTKNPLSSAVSAESAPDHRNSTLKTTVPINTITGLKPNAAKKQTKNTAIATRKNNKIDVNRSMDDGFYENLESESVHLPGAILPATIHGIYPEQFNALVIAPTDLAARNQLSAGLVTPKKITKPDKWHAAIIVGAGASSMVESGLQQYNSIANEYLGSVNIPSGIAAIQQRPSDVKAGPAFHAGIQVSRTLTRRLSVSMGLQYAFFSNQIIVGNSPDSTIAIYNDRQELVSNTAAYKAAGNSGDKFYNQFHFIQVPLEFSVGLDKKQRWHYSAGVSIGYLVGSNALQYNGQAGVYYRNNDAFRKWQPAIFTGVQYRFSKVNKIPFQVGPFAQYQLNSLDKTISNKHVLVYGLAAKFQIK